MVRVTRLDISIWLSVWSFDRSSLSAFAGHVPVPLPALLAIPTSPCCPASRSKWPARRLYRTDAIGRVRRRTAPTASSICVPAPTTSPRSRCPGFTTPSCAKASCSKRIHHQKRKKGGGRRLRKPSTVSAALLVVDASSTMSRNRLLSRGGGQIEALPTGRSYQSLSAMIPALSPAGDRQPIPVGGASQMWQGTGVASLCSLANDTALEAHPMSVMTLLNQGLFDCRRVPQPRVPKPRPTRWWPALPNRTCVRPHQHDSEGRRQLLQRRLSRHVFELSTSAAKTPTPTRRREG